MPARCRQARGGILAAALLLAACGAGGAELSALEGIRARWGAPALGAATVEAGRLAELEVVGVRRQGDLTPATAADRFPLGSCTKAVTATLVATFVDEGRLTWDAELAQAWPEIVPFLHPGHLRVTVAQLLAHRAGLDDDVLLLRHAASLDPTQPVPTQRRWVAETVLGDAPSRPGEHAYSNLGYVVVAALLEHLGGAPWEDLVSQRVLGPLGMLSCGFGTPGTPGQVDQPWGHLAQGGGLVPVAPGSPADDDPALFAPAGLLHCSLEDWSRFALLHLGGEGGTLVSAASLERMHTPWPGGTYALGWTVAGTAEGPVLSHTGSNERSFAAVELRPRERRGAMAVANCGGTACAAAVGEALAAALGTRP